MSQEISLVSGESGEVGRVEDKTKNGRVEAPVTS